MNCSFARAWFSESRPFHHVRAIHRFVAIMNGPLPDCVSLSFVDPFFETQVDLDAGGSSNSVLFEKLFDLHSVISQELRSLAVLISVCALPGMGLLLDFAKLCLQVFLLKPTLRARCYNSDANLSERPNNGSILRRCQQV